MNVFLSFAAGELNLKTYPNSQEIKESKCFFSQQSLHIYIIYFYCDTVYIYTSQVIFFVEILCRMTNVFLFLCLAVQTFISPVSKKLTQQSLENANLHHITIMRHLPIFINTETFAFLIVFFYKYLTPFFLQSYSKCWKSESSFFFKGGNKKKSGGRHIFFLMLYLVD